ncbi:hypothetical protein B9Z55_013149 [Caenorhabditis nigoni]|uniref:Mos1 transposase HTH domain-containing protein n=1 Tax=Caenorhabditis nigoni TaxID=1611254 RepID=A0A2G5U0L3_9PELO|nr:hypothetical protein B9Z55_013149 [Caenorhabditis nigoni]
MKNEAKPFRSLSKVFKYDPLSENLLRRWFKRYGNDGESVEDHEHTVRPKIIGNELLKDTIESDLCQTTRNLAEQLPCTHSAIEKHFHILEIRTDAENFPHKNSLLALIGIILLLSTNIDFLDSAVTWDDKAIQYGTTT